VLEVCVRMKTRMLHEFNMKCNKHRYIDCVCCDCVLCVYYGNSSAEDLKRRIFMGATCVFWIHDSYLVCDPGLKHEPEFFR